MDVKLQSKKFLDWFQDDRLTFENQANYLSKLISLRERLYEKNRIDFESHSISHFKLNSRSLLASNDTCRNSLTPRNSSYNMFIASSSNFNSTESKSSSTESQSAFNAQSFVLSSASKSTLKPSQPILFKFPSRKTETSPIKPNTLNKSSLSIHKKDQSHKQFFDVVDGKKVFEKDITASTEHVSSTRQMKQPISLNTANLESINRLKKLLNLEEPVCRTQSKDKVNLSNAQNIRRNRNPLSTFRGDSNKFQATFPEKNELRVSNTTQKEKPKTVKKLMPKAKSKYDASNQRKVLEYCYSSFNVAISIHGQSSYQTQSNANFSNSNRLATDSTSNTNPTTYRSQNGTVSSSNRTTLSTVNSKKDFEVYSSFESSAAPCTPKGECDSPTCLLCTMDRLESARTENLLKVPVVSMKSKNSDSLGLYEQKTFDLVNPQNSPEPSAEFSL